MLPGKDKNILFLLNVKVEKKLLVDGLRDAKGPATTTKDLGRNPGAARAAAGECFRPKALNKFTFVFLRKLTKKFARRPTLY